MRSEVMSVSKNLIVTLAGLLAVGIAFGAAVDRADAQCYGYSYYSYCPPPVYVASPPVVLAPPAACVAPSRSWYVPGYTVCAPVPRGVYYRSNVRHRVYRSPYRYYRAYPSGCGRGFGFGFRVNY
jgi:hypothetical protein